MMQQTSLSKPSTTTKTRRPAAIFDMDGTLVDVSNIKYHVDLNDPRNTGHKDFASFHSASLDAPPHEWVAELARSLHAAGVAIIVVTARKFKWRYHSLIWLHLNNIPYDLLQMRPDLDMRSDVYVKRDIFEVLSDRFRFQLALEDNPFILDLWEELGIPTVRVPGWTSNSKPGTTFVDGKEVTAGLQID